MSWNSLAFPSPPLPSPPLPSPPLPSPPLPSPPLPSPPLPSPPLPSPPLSSYDPALLKKILRHNPAKRHTLDKIRSHIWCRKSYPTVDQSSQEALTLVSPTHRPSKRVQVESSPRYAERNSRWVVVLVGG